MPGVKVHPATRAVFDLIDGLIPQPVGLGMAPTPEELANNESRRKGYVVLKRFPIGPEGGIGHGYVGQVDSMRVVRFGAIGCGIQYDQAELLSGQAAGIILDKTPTGGYLNSLTSPDVTFLRRAFAGELSPDRQGSWQVTTLFDLWIAVN